ncbi:TPA: PBECR4 domain-containing protein [Streptococcus suis]
MESLLHSAAKNYEKLLYKNYQIILGRKGQQSILNLIFSEEHFVHLAGLHKLKGVSFPTRSKSEIYKLILNKTISEESLTNAIGYSDIGGRLRILEILKESFSFPNLSVRFTKLYPIKGSKIRWEYLLEFSFDDKIGYLFLDRKRNSKEPNHYIPVSTFEKSTRDYTINQVKYTVLEILEFDLQTKQTRKLYSRLKK